MTNMAAVTSHSSQQLSLKQVQRSKSNCRIPFNDQAAYRRAGKVDAQLFFLFAFLFSVALRTTSRLSMCFILLQCSTWMHGRAQWLRIHVSPRLGERIWIQVPAQSRNSQWKQPWRPGNSPIVQFDATPTQSLEQPSRCCVTAVQFIFS